MVYTSTAGLSLISRLTKNCYLNANMGQYLAFLALNHSSNCHSQILLLQTGDFLKTLGILKIEILINTNIIMNSSFVVCK